MVIAGGGFAAVEAALAPRALAGDRVRLTAPSPDPFLRYRPAATLDAFDSTPLPTYSLRRITDDVGADYRETQIVSVAPESGYLWTSSGDRLPYDALVLAIGARAVAGIPGALTFRDQRDAHRLARILRELEDGAVRRIVFAAPPSCAWPLPLYELALMCAKHAGERELRVAISVVSPEHRPLDVFGHDASDLVGGLLAERGVSFVAGARAKEIRRNGSLELESGTAIAADRVVALPELHGWRITGVPANQVGLVPVDASGRAQGLDNVYAAGDMTTFAIKQGGLATQAADRIAHTIAAGLGAPVKERRTTHVLRARLVGGDRTLCLRAELDWSGQPTAASLEYADAEPADVAAKLFGLYLTPYLSAIKPLAGSGTP